MSPVEQHTQEARLLHQGGRAGHWGSLGLWPALDYGSACEALADRVAQAAQLQPGARILSPGCGDGEELTHWHRRYGASQVIGVDPAEAAVGVRAGPAAVRRIQGDAMSLAPLCGAGFDAVLCVDAAYHFSPRTDWLQQVRSVLKPGGRVVFTDLTLQPNMLPLTAARWLLAPVGQGAGIVTADLMPLSAGIERLKALGFTQVRSEALNSEVLDGFAAFVQAQSQRLGHDARLPGWRRVAATARALPWARRLGLGYALFCARWPGSTND